MASRKERRESGRKYNKHYEPDKGFYNEQYWDDWNDYRDGQRDITSDSTIKKPKHIDREDFHKINKKIRKHKHIRMLKKQYKKKGDYYEL